MDVVVADIPPKYGMLLSRSWGAKLQGSLQLDMSYATISVFGQPKRLYKETLMKYMVSSEEKPQNFPIYAVHSDIDSYILFNDTTTPPKGKEDSKTLIQEEDTNEQTATQETMIKQALNTATAQESEQVPSSEETALENKQEGKPELQLTNPTHKEITKFSLEPEIWASQQIRGRSWSLDT